MPRNVLVVDDDMIIRSLISEAMSLIGLQAVESDSADEALKHLDAGVEFALIITDVQMPGSMYGLALSRMIWEKWPHLPVLVISGNTVLPQGILPHNARFLTKPVSLDDLERAVVSLLAQ